MQLLDADPSGEEAGSNAARVHATDSPTVEAGGAGRDRTDDPLLAKQVLSQLSYSPKLEGKSLRPDCLRDAPGRSGLRWWAWIELNYRPRAYQARALTN